MSELGPLVDRIAEGWSRVTYGGQLYGVTKAIHADGRSLSIYAEQLGGDDVVSANVHRTRGGDVLKPCEMSAAKVIDFLHGVEDC